MGSELLNNNVLLLHGLTSSPTVFNALKEFLSKRNVYCFAPALPGHGGHVTPATEVRKINYLSELDDHVNSLTLAGQRQIDIVGSSFGALLTLFAVKKFPALIRRVVILSPPIDFRLLVPRLSMSVLSILPEFIAGLLGSVPKNLVSVGEHEEGDSYTINMLSILAKLRQEILDQEINYQGRVLLIQSTYDHHLSPSSLYKIKNILPNANIQVEARDWGKEHGLVEMEEVIGMIGSFIASCHA